MELIRVPASSDRNTGELIIAESSISNRRVHEQCKTTAGRAGRSGVEAGMIDLASVEEELQAEGGRGAGRCASRSCSQGRGLLQTGWGRTVLHLMLRRVQAAHQSDRRPRPAAVARQLALPGVQGDLRAVSVMPPVPLGGPVVLFCQLHHVARIRQRNIGQSRVGCHERKPHPETREALGEIVRRLRRRSGGQSS